MKLLSYTVFSLSLFLAQPAAYAKEPVGGQAQSAKKRSNQAMNRIAQAPSYGRHNTGSCSSNCSWSGNLPELKFPVSA